MTATVFVVSPSSSQYITDEILAALADAPCCYAMDALPDSAAYLAMPPVAWPYKITVTCERIDGQREKPPELTEDVVQQQAAALRWVERQRLVSISSETPQSPREVRAWGHDGAHVVGRGETLLSAVHAAEAAR